MFKNIVVQDFPQLLRLKEKKEENEELLTLGSEDFLKRWQFQIKRVGHSKVVTNFSNDVKDSERYILIKQLEPSCDSSNLGEGDLVKRAGIVLDNATKDGAKI